MNNLKILEISKNILSVSFLENENGLSISECIAAVRNYGKIHDYDFISIHADENNADSCHVASKIFSHIAPSSDPYSYSIPPFKKIEVDDLQLFKSDRVKNTGLMKSMPDTLFILIT